MRDATVLNMSASIGKKFEALASASMNNTMILSTQVEHMNNRIAAMQDVLFSRFSIFVPLLGLFWPRGVHRILEWRERLIAIEMAKYAQEVKERRDKAAAERQAKIRVVQPHETNGLVKPS